MGHLQVRPEGNCGLELLRVPGMARRWSALAAMAFIAFIHGAILSTLGM